MTDVLGRLEKVVGAGQARFRILAYFLRHPKEQRHSASMANLLHLPEASVRRALHFLALQKILIKMPTRYRNYFRLHPDFPKELRLFPLGQSFKIPAASIHGRYD